MRISFLLYPALIKIATIRSLVHTSLVAGYDQSIVQFGIELVRPDNTYSDDTYFPWRPIIKRVT